VKRSKLALAVSMVIAAGTMLPALADDDGLGKAVDSGLLVTRVGGLGAAWIVGCPIAVIRETTKSYISMTSAVADKIGGHNFGPSVLVASVVTAPAALVVGSAKGVYAGTKNAVDGFNEPFKPDSFSIGNLEE
jgi:hypothetical protein